MQGVAARREVQLDNLLDDELPFAGRLGSTAALALLRAQVRNLGAVVAITADEEHGSAIDIEGFHFVPPDCCMNIVLVHQVLQVLASLLRSSAASSSSVNTRERVMKRTPSGASSEKPEPRPLTTSMMRWVCCQYSNCEALM